VPEFVHAPALGHESGDHSAHSIRREMSVDLTREDVPTPAEGVDLLSQPQCDRHDPLFATFATDDQRPAFMVADQIIEVKTRNLGAAKTRFARQRCHQPRSWVGLGDQLVPHSIRRWPWLRLACLDLWQTRSRVVGTHAVGHTPGVEADQCGAGAVPVVGRDAGSRTQLDQQVEFKLARMPGCAEPCDGPHLSTPRAQRGVTFALKPKP